MGQKLSIPKLTVLHFIHDFSLENIANGSTKLLGDLPDGFVIQSIRLQELVALTASSTIALGEDGGGDADGYLIAVDPAATQRGKGALVWDATSGNEFSIEHVVAASKDGLLMTVAGANAVVGKVAVLVQGYQSF